MTAKSKVDFEKWLMSFRCLHRTKQISWLKSYILKQRHKNMHMGLDAFVMEFGNRMAFFLDAKKRDEACKLATKIATECHQGRYEPAPAYRGYHAQVAMKARQLDRKADQHTNPEPYVAPVYAKNDGDVHTIDLEAE